MWWPRRAARLAANNQAKASFLAAGGSVKEYKREKARATRESAGAAMMDCVEGKIEELELNEGEKPSASEMRQAKTDCKEEAEEAFLDFSSTTMPGVQVLPAITGRARKNLLLAPSASAPTLPQLGSRRASASSGSLRGAPLPL